MSLRPCLRLYIPLLLALAVLFSYPPPAVAEAALTVQVIKEGQVAEIAAYTAADLAALGEVQHYYSSLDAAGTPIIVVASGIPITVLLADIGLSPADADSLRFASSDGGNRSYGLDAYVNADRWYFPRIMEAYDPVDDTQSAFTDGAEEGKTTVPALLALSSYECDYGGIPDTASMDSQDGYRFCFGQSAINESVHINFSKHINKLIISLKGSSAYQLPDTAAPIETAAPTLGPPASVPVEGIAEVLDTTGLAADSLTITVGYYGGTYYTKKVFSDEELAAMATVQQVYTLLDAMPAVCLDAAVGVPLADILTAAGIDLASVQTLHFYCADVARTWYASMSKNVILDKPRYYYPKLPKYWNYEESEPAAGATAEAEQVDTIIAVQDKWRRMATSIDFNDLTSTTRYRLVFGQQDATTAEGTRSAKWVHTISVTLGGAPPQGVSLDASVLELTVGSTYQLNATVEKGDKNTDTRIIWSSSDEQVLSVDENGKITVEGEGEATVTATTMVGGLTAQVLIKAGVEPAAALGEPGGGDAAASGDRSGGTGGSGVYRIRLVEQGSADGQSSDGAIQPWRSSGMGGGAVALPKLETENPLTHITWLALCALFAAGILGRIMIYFLEV